MRPLPRATEDVAARQRLVLLAVFLAFHFGVSWFAVVPGYLSVDEGTYHLMVKNLAEGHVFEIWNGYRERPSPELQVGPIWVRGGRLVAAPPEGFTFAALPFYRLLGYRGLFLLNALAFVAVLAVTWDLARRLFADRVLALDAVLVLALATYLWDYSQAAWPHALATLVVAAAVAAVARSLCAEDDRGRLGWAAVAGCLAGLGPAVRMDAGFALPAALLPFLFARPPRLREAAAALLGLAPGMAFLAFVNHEKFGTWSPFSYGKQDASASSGVGVYLPLAALAAVAVAALWILSRRPIAARLQRPRVAAAAAGAGVLVALAALLALPALRQLAGRTAVGLWQLIVDLRGRDIGLAEPALGRTAGGGMVYIGGFKKALLQSCPYLTVLAVPAVTAWRDPRLGWRVALLALVPAAYVAPYSFFAWHGGLSLNLRYWTPILPFTAVLTALALAWLREGRRHSHRREALVSVLVLTVVFAAVVRPRFGDLATLEPLLLTLPLALAAVVLTLALGTAVPSLARRPGWSSATTAALAASMTWAALVTFTYDAPLARQQRSRNLAAAAALAPHVEPDSLLFVPYPDPFYGLLEIDALRLAIPFRDDFADFRPLAEHHLAAGRPVYAVLPDPVWQELGRRGMLAGLEARMLHPPARLVRLRLTTPVASSR